MSRSASLANVEEHETRVEGRLTLSGVLLGVVIGLLCVGSLLCFGVASSEADPRAAAGFDMSLSAPFAPDIAAPAATAASEESRTRYAGLRRDAAVELAKRVFDVGRPMWTPPGSLPGHSLGRYFGRDAVQERLPGGGRVVVSSSFPLEMETGSGMAPTSLKLEDAGEAYAPANPVVPVAISQHASGGVAFEGGLSVAPVGAASPEAAVIQRNQVFFANEAKDTDMMIEPTISGAEMSWQLRSAQSPSALAVRVNLPEGGALQSSRSVPGAVEARAGGDTTLLIRPATATDATGRELATSYSMDGDVLTTHVDLSGGVEFPVLVDPTLSLLFVGYDGTYNGAGTWNGFEHLESWGSGWVEHSNLLEEGANPGAPIGSYGEWLIWAPGLKGRTGSAGITRVDLAGLSHRASKQSRLVARISYSNGENGWTFNGFNGIEHLGELLYENNLTGQAAVICAQAGNGRDGGEKSLCEEQNYQGENFEVMDEILGSQTERNYASIEGAQITYRDPANPSRVVLNHGSYQGQWVRESPSGFTIEGEDEGLGIEELQLWVPLGSEKPYASERLSCGAQNGFYGCPASHATPSINLSSIAYEKGTGIYYLMPEAVDAAKHTQALTVGSAEEKEKGFPIYIDRSGPSVETLGGSLGAAANGIIGSGSYTLTFSATDGTGKPEGAQSGVRKLEVKMDGAVVSTVNTTCGEPHGIPSEACEKLAGNWTMSGESYGVGAHTVTVVATDWAGNVSERSIVVTSNNAASDAAGPGSVNLQTGDFKLNPTDVAVAAGPASLSVDRAFDSRNLTQGASGPLGPQWQLSLPDVAAAGAWHSLSVLPNTSVVISTTSGGQLVFPPSGNSYASPPGYQADTLTKLSASEYQLTDQEGNYTTFKQSEAGAPFLPVTVAQATAAGGLNNVASKFTTKEGITEPTQVLGPEPSAGACTTELVKGCRALSFVYSSSTEAESGSEWGQYKGRLWKIEFTGWDTSESRMKTTAVAQYAYDSEGRLRQEWDPRISPALKTTYGYDSEGHVTAISLPGLQPWLIHYGTTAADTKAGRTLSVARFNAEASLWKGEKLKNTAAPTLSTSSPVIGTQLSATNGSWNATTVYGYQWERCSASGTECAPIAGAVNQTYTPVVADFGHTLASQVTATDAWGSVTIQTASSSKVLYTHATWASSFGSLGSGAGQLNGPTGPALTSDGKLWVADSANRRIDEFSASGTFIETIGWGVKNGKAELQTCTSTCQSGIWGAGKGQLEDPEGIAVNQSNGWLYVADGEDNLIQEYNPTGGQEGTASWVGSFAGTGSGEGKLNGPKGIALDAANDLWVADYGNNRLEEFSSTGGYLKTLGKLGSGHGEYKGPTAVIVVGGNLYVTDSGNGRVQELTTTGEWEREFATKGSGEGQLEYPWGLAYDSQNEDIYVNSYGANKIEAFTLTGTYVEQFGAYGTGKEQFHGPSGIAVNGATGAIEIADEYNERIDVWAPTGVISEEPIQPAPNPGTTSVATFEYNVPLSGTGLPNLSEAETTKWAQKDAPAEGTAVFPGDEPQSWPAGSYKRASIYYLDSANRTVNTASPAGAIMTTEYGANNDNVERILTAENREKALKEANTKEAAERLSTVNEYSPDGTELQSTLGPEHQVKIAASGSTIAARKHVRYFYDEGAPGTGGPYRLVTKTFEGAKPINGAENEQDITTVTTRYSGQENLGWKLHAPTETETTSGSGQTLKTITQYDGTTGQVSESAKTTPTPPVTEYALPAGSQPFGITPGPDNNVWFTDYGTGKVGKISAVGAINEYKAEPDGPEGITTGSDGNLWFVENTVRNVNRMTPAGTLTVHTLTRPATSNTAITSGPDGNLWFTESFTSRIGKMTPSGEVLGEYPAPAESEPDAITTGPDGNLWFTNYKTSKLGKITTAGTITEYALALNPDAITTGPDGNLWVVEKLGKLVKLNTSGEKLAEYTLPGNAEPTGISTGPDGNIWVAFTGMSKIGQISTSGTILHEYALPTGSKPRQITAGPDGNIYFTDYGTNKIGKITLGDLGNAAAKNTKTTYYTSAPNEAHPNCGKHAEWAGLPCEAMPAAQPGISGAPKRPETSYTYNTWQELVTTTDKIATTPETTRTTTMTYDSAGRLKTTALEATNSSNRTVPTVTSEYSTTTGALKTQTQTVEGEAQSVTSEENTLGALTEYVDSAGNKATYEYEKEKDDRLLKVRDGVGTSAASTDTYSYDPTSGFLTSLKDEGPHGAGTFTASYDSEGNAENETLPNGVTAKYGYNQEGERTSLEYVKGAVSWFSDTTTPSIHGQVLAQTSSLSKENYAYDETSRLTETQETPSGEGCTTHLYAYDEDGNRTSLTTRNPGSEGKCATEGGTSQPYTYDTGDRLLGTGVSYETFGNTTALPGTYAGGTPLTSTYYIDNHLATQEQNGQKLSYTYDSAGRIRQTTMTGTETGTITDHYAGPAPAPAWTIASNGKWVRDIVGINGALTAIEENGATPTLQLADLTGNIIGTAQDSESETKFQAASQTNEYGVPKTSVKTKYAWHGTEQQPTELPTGIINMGARTYVPQLGRFEQTDPQPGGSINSYAYTTDDPVNQTDPTGEELIYNNESAETGAPAPGTPTSGLGPGAIIPPPAEVLTQEAFAALHATTAASVAANATARAAISVVLPSSYPCFDKSSRACKAAERDLKGSESEGEFWHAVFQVGEYASAVLLPEVDVEELWVNFARKYPKLAKAIIGFHSKPVATSPALTAAKEALKKFAHLFGG